MKVSKNLILVLLVSFVLMFNTMVMAGGGGGSEVPSPNQVANMKIDYLTSSNSWDISGWDGYYDKRRSYSYEPYCDNFPSSDRSNYKCDLYRIYYKDFYVSEKSDFKIEYDFKESEWMDRFHQTVFSSLKKIESDGSLMENESGTKSWIDNDYYEHDYNDYRIDQGDQAYRIDELASGWYRLEMGVVLESDGWENYDSITSDQPGATGAEYYGYDSKNPFPIMSRGCGTKIITIGEKYTGWPTMNIEDASPDRTYCGKSKSYWVSELNDLSPRHYLDEKAVFYYIPGYAEFSSIKIEWYNNTSNPPENPGANQPPSINVSNKSVNENNTLTVNLNGYSSDPDGDSLSFSKVSGPGYMSGDYYKMNTNYYGANDAGSYSVKVKVSDGKGGVDYDWFT
ncbi:MAG: Ig-like domain-containing protein, partial [Bacillota bacterium]